jgi:hypothetical protein
MSYDHYQQCGIFVLVWKILPDILLNKKQDMGGVPVAHTYNPSYPGAGRAGP